MFNFQLKKKKTIYEKINAEIQNKGSLSYDFKVEEAKIDDNKLRFSPGLREYFGWNGTDSEKDNFINEFKKYFDIQTPKAFNLFEKKFANKIEMVSLRKTILDEISNNKNKYNPNKVYDLACYFIKNGTHCETIKLGLILLALIDTNNKEEICDIIKTIAHYEEFTDYVITNTYNWEEQERQKFYFDIAKKLNGWGKISIVEVLEADTEEKKEWILCHGCKNAIMYSYLGYICAKKAELYKKLKKGNLTAEEFSGATDIIEGLIDEGPCAGMSIMENPVDLTMCYLKEFEKNSNNDVDYIDVLSRIDYYFENSKLENKKIIKQQIATIMKKIDLDKIINDSIEEKTFQCISIARKNNIDISKRILSLIATDFNKYYFHSNYLFDNNIFINEFLDICDKVIDEKIYPNKMGESFGLGIPKDGTIKIDMIVQYLGKYPLKAKKLVKISINSPITRWRNMAARCLKEWTETLNKPLKDIDKELYNMVKSIEKKEVNDETKKRWNELL